MKAKNITFEDIEQNISGLRADTFPKRYNIHKYWGKKPANVFSDLINFFTNEGDTVLDPFSGSGITATEAIINARNGIGIDINPFAIKLSDTAVKHYDVKDFKKKAHALVDTLIPLSEELYGTVCRECGDEAVAVSYGWEVDELKYIKYKCSCSRKTLQAPPSKADIQKAAVHSEIPFVFPDKEMHFGWEMQKLKRGGVKRFSDLFTNRNLYMTAAIFDAIKRIDDASMRAMLQITFSANLVQGTRMIADSKNGGGPSWKINCYWLPTNWQELNVLHYFRNRISKTESAIKELKEKLANDNVGKHNFEVADSRNLQEYIEAESVDYILTDPPYGGEGIQYGELSMLWNLWLEEAQNLDAEIAENPYRNKNLDSYREGLEAVFRECFRVLKPGSWMSVTFNNKDTKVWDALMSACLESGFVLQAVSPLNRSAPSLTEHTTNVAPKIDVLLHFQKPGLKTTGRKFYENVHLDLKQRVEILALKAIQEKGFITTNKLLEELTMEWLTFYYAGEKKLSEYTEISIKFINDALMKVDDFVYIRNENPNKYDDYIWRLN